MINKEFIRMVVVPDLIESNYHIAATGFRDCSREEIALLVEGIFFSCIAGFDLKNYLDNLYSTHPDTIEMDKSFFAGACRDFDAKKCDCWIKGSGEPWCEKEKKEKVRRNRNSLEYQMWRKSVFERDDYTCQRCGVVGGTLNAHHIEHWAKNKELRLEVSNGLTLCEECHRSVHSKGA